MTSERDAHPDEGTIHAWLERQLDDASSDALEAHLQRCDECAERVAEARGLIAGASRVIASLDDVDAVSAGAAEVGAPAVTPWGRAALPTTRVRGLPTFRLTPARSAIAAVLVVAVATAIVHEKQRPSSRLASVAAESAAAVASGVTPLSGAPAVATAPATVPEAAPATGGLDSTAATRVATARTYAKAQRETTVSADLARVGQVPAPQASTPVGQAVAAARAADNVVALRAAAPGVVATDKAEVAAGTAKAAAGEPLAAAIEAPLCYRVETANGSTASWGPVALPFTLALDAPVTRASARIVTAGGHDADVRARFERRGEDSLLFTLQRIGYSGTLLVGAPGEVRAGVMRSAPTSVALGQVVVTSEPSAAEQRRALRTPGAAAAARADSAVAPARDATPAVPVVLRKVECTGRE